MARRGADSRAMDRTDVLVIGAGQAGLAASHELMAAGVEHVVVDRARLGQAWRDRWDSFCLVTPNATTLQLPGFPYSGDDPDGYLPRDGAIQFRDDLPDSVAWGDARHDDLMHLFAQTARDRGLPAPGAGESVPFVRHGPSAIPVDGLAAVVFAGGFRPGYRHWLPWPDAFDEAGFPIQHDGRSTVIEGLYFLGVHFLRTRRSSLLFGVGGDATVVAQDIAA